MITVKLEEKAREYEVHVGTLRIGKVVVFPWANRACAYAVDTEHPQGIRFLDGAACRTLKQATDRILEYLDYGRCDDVEVKRAPGGIAR